MKIHYRTVTYSTFEVSDTLEQMIREKGILERVPLQDAINLTEEKLGIYFGECAYPFDSTTEMINIEV